MRGGPEGKPPAGGEIECMGRSSDDGEDRGNAAAAEPFLQRPQRVLGTAGADDDKARRIEAESREAGAEWMAGLAERHFLFDPEDRLGRDGHEPRQQRRGKTGQRTAAPRLV